MGASSSKTAAIAAITSSSASKPNTVRKYPMQLPTHIQKRPQEIEHDASDPDMLLNARARMIGPVQPNPTYSPSSASSIAPTTNSAPPSTPFHPSTPQPAQKVYPYSASSEPLSNPAVSLLTARYRIAEEAEQEFATLGKSTNSGRVFIDVKILSQALALRDEGIMREKDIERKFGFREGIMAELGRRDVVSSVGYEERKRG